MISLIILFLIISLTEAFCGPPFFTDDPEPLDLHGWEFYLSSEAEFSSGNIDATLPHFEANYGLFNEGQVHLLVPLEYIRSGGSSEYDAGNVEIGVKYRFYHDSEDFQIGTFPLAEIPAGKNESFSAFIPVWLQKDFGKLTTFGGVGYWYNSAEDMKDQFFAGWECQYDLSETLTLGGELYYQTAGSNEDSAVLGFNLGGYINITSNHHIIFSGGSTLTGGNDITTYFGYQLTF